MKNHLQLFPFVLFASFCFLACDNDDKITLSIESTSIALSSSDAQEKKIAIQTNAASVEVEVSLADQEWCQAEIEGEYIIITVSENSSPDDSRIATIIIKAEGINPQSIEITQPPREKSSHPEFKSFIIPAEINKLKNDIEGIIDNEQKTITIATKEWIANVKNLIVKFEAIGTVYIGETEQISETTTNSFFNKLTYRITSEVGGNSIEYDIVTIGPMFTGLPIISIDIDEGLEVVEKTKKLPATLYLIDPNNEAFDMNETDMTIRGRGNTTWHRPKKPYRIDFPEKTSVFGLSKAKKWILLANYQDPTLLMNDVTFELGHRLGLQFTHSSIHTELFVNGKYRGNYQLTEQKEIGEGRVDIDKKEGFLVELDTYYDEDYKFRTKHLSLPVMVADPDLNNEEEMDYIKKEIQGLEDALFEEDFPNNNYEKFTDVPSLIDFILINEIVRNRELLSPKSSYCYKDIDTKIMWGPLWDFDWAFGYNDTNAYFEKNDIIYSPEYSGISSGGLFFCRLFKDPKFVAKYKARWKEVRPQVLDLMNYMDIMAVKLNKSQAENFELPTAKSNTKNTSYEALISQMKDWLSTRITILDNEIDKF